MKIIFTLAAIIFSFILSGCIEISTKININPDGSGTVEETVLMSNEMISMLNEFITGFASDTAKPEEFKLYQEEDIKERASEMGEGVKFVFGQEIKEENKEGYKVVYSFSDLNKLRIDQSPDSRIPDDATGIEVTEKKFVTFSFKKGNTSEIKINLPDTDSDEDEMEEEVEVQEDSLNEKDFNEMKFFLKDLSFFLVVNVNGEVAETNSDYLEGTEVTLLKLSFGELLENPEKLKELNKINPDSPQELKDVMKDIPGIKIEINNPVVIKFR